MPEPPQLTPLGAEEQRLCSELLPDGRAPHPVSKGEPGLSAEEANFSRLYPRSCFFCHYPKLVTIGEGRNRDQPVNRKLCLSAQLPLCRDGPAQIPHHYGRRTNPPVDLSLHFPLTREQDPKVLELLHLGQDLPPPT